MNAGEMRSTAGPGGSLETHGVSGQGPSPEAPHARGPAGRIRIVLLEDSEPDVELIQEALLESGLNISMVSVDTREDFEAELRRHTPNIILSDYWLGNFDGAAALEI